MQIPKLSGAEFLIEEGRLPGLLFSTASFCGMLALILGLFLFPVNREAIVSDLTTSIDVLAVAGALVSGWKTYINYKKNGTSNGTH